MHDKTRINIERIAFNGITIAIAIAIEISTSNYETLLCSAKESIYINLNQLEQLVASKGFHFEKDIK